MNTEVVLLDENQLNRQDALDKEREMDRENIQYTHSLQHERSQ